MKRILMLMAVSSVMAALMVAMAMPVFAVEAGQEVGECVPEAVQQALDPDTVLTPGLPEGVLECKPPPPDLDELP